MLFKDCHCSVEADLWLSICCGLEAPCTGIDAGIEDGYQHASSIVLRVLLQEPERTNLRLRHGAGEQVRRRCCWCCCAGACGLPSLSAMGRRKSVP